MIFVKIWIAIGLVMTVIYLIGEVVWSLGKGYILGLFAALKSDRADSWIAWYETSDDLFDKIMVWEAKRMAQTDFDEEEES